MSQGSFNPKIRFLGKKLCIESAHGQTHEHTETQTDRVNTEVTLSGFQECFLQPIIMDRSNISDFEQRNNKHNLMQVNMMDMTFKKAPQVQVSQSCATKLAGSEMHIRVVGVQGKCLELHARLLPRNPPPTFLWQHHHSQARVLF